MENSILRSLILSFVLLFLGAGIAHAQLTVVSSSPSDGELNVPTLATLQVQFSAPIDTTARFDDGEDFYLAFETSPEIPQPTIAGVSPDFTTFFAQVFLEPDTQYMVLLTGAKSQAGDVLSQPFVVTFSTGSSLPTGSVSGTITDAGNGKTAAGVLVAVFPDDPLGGIFSDDGDLFNAAVTNASGQYTINYVADGSYQVASAGDTNGDGLIEPEGGDTFGLYDADGDGLLDPIEVSGGGATSGINFSVKIPLPVSAKTNLPRANPIATSVNSDAVLVLVNGQFGPGGLSPQWLYVYYSPSQAANFMLIALGDQFGLSPYEDFGGGTDLTEPLPADFLDSDVIGGIANENGGADFLTQFQNVEVSGFGANFTDTGFGKTERQRVDGPRRVFDLSRPAGMGLAARSGKTGLVTPTPLWYVIYTGDTTEFPFFGFLNVVIHAQTGEVDPALAYYTAARANLSVANAAATAWAASAQLVFVESGNIGVHRSGKSSEWSYGYRSAANTAYEVVVQEGEILSQNTISLAQLPSTQFLPESWVDSPDASDAADIESGDFRNVFNNVRVEAVLAKDIDFNNPTRSVWEFRYFEGDTGTDVTVLIDAETGLVVGTDDEGELPTSLRLDQNYPNPFNPSTSISYEVPSSGLVRLTVFDLLGREVRVLVDGEMAAGRYVISWDGMDENRRAVSSGIYVYRIEAAGASETRSMTLLR